MFANFSKALQRFCKVGWWVGAWVRPLFWGGWGGISCVCVCVCVCVFFGE